ncbi:MAG: hypothetical protein KDA21_15025, partial [Phycisphaerales bacterium]|nr:hypothetical protein [Phycisphaerales bacterium]
MARQRQDLGGAGGVSIIFDDATFRLTDAGGGRPETRRRTRGRRGGAPVGGDSPGDQVAGALPGEAMEVVEVVELEPRADAPRRRGATARRVTIAATVSPTESALVLVEQDGVLSWRLPTESERVPAGRRRRGGGGGTRQLTFEIDVDADVDAGGPEGRRRRGIVGDLVIGRVKAWVIRIAARVALAGAMAWLERKVQTGLVHLGDPEPALWQRLEGPPRFEVHGDRPLRLLLFVHGTFSSTLNGYGALGAFDWGRAFLRGAMSQYDALLGYDHATLSVDPLQNAMDLLDRLRAVGRPMVIDTVSHSRGGLVVRSLVEHLLPVVPDSGIVLARNVMVATPNGGTTLAEPKNWKSFLDLYTNLATAAFRVLQLAPPLTVAARVLEEVVTGLSSFAAYMAEHAMEAGGVPGLAAMQPRGSFIRDLNLPQAPPPSVTQYFAITSDFRAALGADGKPLAEELPRKLVMLLADAATGQLIRGENDLVVNTGSMTTVGDDMAHLLKARHDFGTNPHVFHTTYFSRPEVCGCLSRWLLARPESRLDAVALASDVEANILTFEAERPWSDLQEEMARLAEPPAYVVLRRWTGEVYAFTAAEIAHPPRRATGSSRIARVMDL